MSLSADHAEVLLSGGVRFLKEKILKERKEGKKKYIAFYHLEWYYYVN